LELPEFYEYRGRCLVCDMVARNSSRKYASFWTRACFLPFSLTLRVRRFETWIIPKNHDRTLKILLSSRRRNWFSSLKRSLALIERGWASPYNYMLFTSPFDAGACRIFNWHIEIIPRLTKLAGFEWGTGFYINPCRRKTAAEFF